MSLDATGLSTNGGATPNLAPGGDVQIPDGSSSTVGTAPGTPQVIDLTDDSMVRVPGQKDPVKYGEYYRGFQSQFTRKAQEAARAAERSQQLEQAIRERDERLAYFQRQQQSAQQAAPGQALREKLAQLPYLSGQQAAEVIEHVGGQFEQFGQALQERDAALVLLTRQLMQVNQVVNSLKDRTSTSDFDGKIHSYVESLGLPNEAEELAKEIYLAYEGDDLDDEFPQILRTRWEQIENAIRQRDRQKVEAARRGPFVPGKGGAGTPSSPLNNLSRASARDIAESLWPGMVDGGPET